MEERECMQHLQAHGAYFSRLGWALFGYMAIVLLVQNAAMAGTGWLAPERLEQMGFRWGVSVLSSYGVGFPVFCILIRRVEAPRDRRPKTPMGSGKLWQIYLIALAALYLTNYATLTLTELIGTLRNMPVSNPVDAMQEYPVALNLLLGCAAAPVAEEIMFRKLLLDRLRPYGDRFAILASAVCFGLFHGNLHQIFYACALGIIFAYVALRTGCVWQTILLHTMVNVVSTGVLPLVLRLGRRGENVLSLFVVGAVAAGMVCFIRLRSCIRLEPGTWELPEGQKWKALLENPGMAFFVILTAALAMDGLIPA